MGGYLGLQALQGVHGSVRVSGARPLIPSRFIKPGVSKQELAGIICGFLSLCRKLATLPKPGKRIIGFGWLPMLDILDKICQGGYIGIMENKLEPTGVIGIKQGFYRDYVELTVGSPRWQHEGVCVCGESGFF